MLWVALLGFGAVSDLHPAWRLVCLSVGGAAAVLLLITFFTLFERTSARCDTGSWALLAMPWAGSGAVALGTLALVQAGPYLATVLSSQSLNSAADLAREFDVAHKAHWPRVVCMDHAFVRTDWEGGKLVCSQQGPIDAKHVVCMEGYSAAPIFRSREEALLGAPDTVHAWALSRGPHVDASYRDSDGALCGFLSGPPIEYSIDQFRFAVAQVVEQQHLQVPVDATPLQARPMILVGNPPEATYKAQMWLGMAVILLVLWPCAGPVPLGLFFLWMSLYRQRQCARLRPLRQVEEELPPVD